MNKSLFILALLFSLAACSRPVPVQSLASEHRADRYNAELLFDKDGCSVYVFRYVGDTHFFVKCAGTTTAQTFDRQHRMVGKVHSSKTRSITTEMKEPIE